MDSYDISNDIVGGEKTPKVDVKEKGWSMGAKILVAIIVVAVLTLFSVGIAWAAGAFDEAPAPVPAVTPPKPPGGNKSGGNTSGGNKSGGNTTTETKPSTLPPAPWTKYEARGCWNDKDGVDRALRTLIHQADYDLTPQQSIDKCANAAKGAGKKLFGLQYGGQCWADDVGHNYKVHGEVSCPNTFGAGLGGDWVNNVYEWN